MPRDLFDSSQNDILSTSRYEDFKKALITSNCTRCDLHKGRTNIVADRGNPASKLMIIGEGPGENEDLQGRAFVGKAGRVMDEMFAEIGIDTNRDALIANVVKCRPPENRAPKREEAHTCIEFLKHQIALVKPHVILLMGATALKHLVPAKKNFSMNEEAGKTFSAADYPNILMMVLYHPAYLLYDARKKIPMREHLTKLASLLKEKGWFHPSLTPAPAKIKPTSEALA